MDVFQHLDVRSEEKKKNVYVPLGVVFHAAERHEMSTYSPWFSVFVGSSDRSRITASFSALLTYHNNACKPPTPVRIIRTRVVLASTSRLGRGKGGFMMEMHLLVPKTPSRQ